MNTMKKKNRLKEHLTNGIDVNTMTTEIIRDLTTVKDTNDITSEQGLARARRVEVQRARKVLIEATIGSK